MNFELVERIPTIEEFTKLRNSVGWGVPSKEQIEYGLNNSKFCICAIYNNITIGCARIVGDGALAYYIQDVIVLPEYQRKGIGGAMMDVINNYIETKTNEKVFVGLMCAKGKEKFYNKYRFVERPNEQYGPGMFRQDLWERK